LALPKKAAEKGRGWLTLLNPSPRKCTPMPTRKATIVAAASQPMRYDVSATQCSHPGMFVTRYYGQKMRFRQPFSHPTSDF
jgi:hypothetical protein